MHSRQISDTRAKFAFLALLLATGICISLLVARAIIFGQYRFSFLPGNLALAWIPLIFGGAVYLMRASARRRRIALVICSIVWFLFYPNAPYLITDLVHLKTRAPVPRWYDLILMMSFAWTGLFLGNLSLYLMQEVVRSRFGRGWSWVFATVMLALGAAGVFLGRFWRWNSWEAVTRPIGLASDALEHLRDMPMKEAALFATTFFAFSALTYLTLYTLTHLHGYAEKNAPPTPELEPGRGKPGCD